MHNRLDKAEEILAKTGNYKQLRSLGGGRKILETRDGKAYYYIDGVLQREVPIGWTP